MIRSIVNWCEEGITVHIHLMNGDELASNHFELGVDTLLFENAQGYYTVINPEAIVMAYPVDHGPKWDAR